MMIAMPTLTAMRDIAMYVEIIGINGDGNSDCDRIRNNISDSDTL